MLASKKQFRDLIPEMDGNRSIGDKEKRTTMSDPRNIAHDKKVQEEKKHRGEEAVPDASETSQPGKKPTLVQNDSPGESYHQHAQHHPSDSPEEK